MSDKDEPSAWEMAIQRTLELYGRVEWATAPRATPAQSAALARADWAGSGKPRVIFNPDIETVRADPVLRVVGKR